MRGIRSRVRAYYSDAIKRYGPTPLGVDWPNVASQQLRFLQLLKLCDFDSAFSLNDFGCGYGALLAYLGEWHRAARIDYRGIDLSPEMIATAQKLWAKKRSPTTFAVGSRCGQVADYSIASGVFNVRLGQPVAAWEAYVEDILIDLSANSRIGFAINFMLPLDSEAVEDELYRTGRSRWLTFCRARLGCAAKTLGDYGLREFTLIARSRR
jgi:SAM-dependent methyltransferase